MKKNFRNIILILLIIFLNQKSYAKPIPPGSGEGDVPANILILLDSSASMGNKLPGGASHGSVVGIQYDSNGNVYVTQHTKYNGVVKFDTDGALDDTFNANEGSWTGRDTDTCTVWFDGASFHADGALSTTLLRPTELRMGQNVKDMNDTTMSEVLFMRSEDRSDTVIGIDPTDGSCKYFIKQHTITEVRNIEVIEASNETHLLVTGIGSGKYWIESYNLTKRDFKVLEITTKGSKFLAKSGDGSINSDYTKWYVLYKGSVYWWNLEAITDGLLGTGETLYTIIDADRITNKWVTGRCAISGKYLISGFHYASEVEVSPDKSDDGDDIIITVSSRHLFQKLEVNDTNDCTVLATGGTYGTGGNAGSSSGGVLADSIYLKKPGGLHVTTNRILIGDVLGHVHEIDEDLFTATNRDTAWRRQMGTEATNRWTGAKAAIRAVLSDSSLTSGAHFGFGHWNAGQGDRDKHADFGGKYCHHNLGCEYYGVWEVPVTTPISVHPKGTSSLCHTDACLMVGISEEGYKEITNVIESIGLAWGTDATAFSQMAHKYFIQDKDVHNLVDSKSPCQLNYVIVIGDGEWTNHDAAATEITELRQAGVKTIVIGYGDGISDRAKINFNKMAVSGSCDAEGNEECHAAIYPETPNELKSELEAKIRQILAERLSFTAPSITATIQEGGSLYQAQFAYEQYGEWHGTILRKTLKADGTVEHDMSASGNWDASVKIQEQAGEGAGAGRNIWSAIDTAGAAEEATDEAKVVGYIGGDYAWNNFHENYESDIRNAFESLDYSIPDYHTSDTTCGEQDEVKGLINFMRGDDFFNYQGDCSTINKTRNHVLGDIYHSQLIEVGKPKANMNFSGTNQEAYWRAMNDYQTFKLSKVDRRNILYAGSNSGMLHAIYADGDEGGKEAWAFIPPPLIGMLPKVINKNLESMSRIHAQTAWANDNVDGETAAEKIVRLGSKPPPGTMGGTNAMFGVDGSPVVHDVYIKGLDSNGNWETDKNWHSILFVPFGRGGAGFSVLDVTNQLIKNNQGPMHMFSIYNDSGNGRVLVYEHDGKLVEKTYSSQQFNFSASLEAKKAKKNEKAAEDADIVIDPTGETYTTRDSIATCQTNEDLGSGNNFRGNGTSSCYKGTTFTFSGPVVTTTDGTTVDPNTLTVEEYDYSSGEQEEVSGWTAKMKDGKFVITFTGTKYINKSSSSSCDVAGEEGCRDTNETNRFTVSTSCTASGGIDPEWDYSQLGETWSAPKIFRIPSVKLEERNDITKDTYVAVMGGGMGNANRCAGSAVYIIDLENKGEIYGAVGPIESINGGPITIVDTTPEGITNAAGATIETEYGSDIANALPSSPIVITPDTSPGIPWRGAMVYFNDLEGKITKINLTNSTKNGADLFDQTTLFNLEANTINKRYSYFAMDAGIGQDKNEFWLFGGTGNFQNLGGYGTGMDNILYGIKDPDFPYFKHLNGVEIPRENVSNFLVKAHEGANAANRIFPSADINYCLDKTGETSGNCPNAEAGWVIHLDTADDMKFRKMSGSPKLFKGQVYYPVYRPPVGQNKCNVGVAFICAADDECGNNTSNILDDKIIDKNKECSEIRQGILSEIVVFGDQIFANVAGPDTDEATLYQTYAIAGEVSSTTSNWRDSSN